MSQRINLSLACGDYEITRALTEGQVAPDGIDLVVLTHDKERFFRLDRRDECDISELNIVKYLQARDAGEPISALPIFLHRRFRHGSIFVNTESGVREPRDLVGRQVGIGGYTPAAAVWLKGILGDQYGVRLKDVDWIDVFGEFGRLPDGQSEPLDPKDGASRLRIDALLETGEVQATISAYNPTAFVRGDPRVARMFPDFESVEKEYFRGFGIFPIMHVLTIKDEVVTQHPWAPASIAEAFSGAKHLALERLRDPRVLPFAFWQSSMGSQEQLMGSDPWAYGLTSGNRRALEAVIRYAKEQELIAGLHAVDDLFLPVDDYSALSKHPV
jgi:4,5-dihydroxyphthalate decarboxylase